MEINLLYRLLADEKIGLNKERMVLNFSLQHVKEHIWGLLKNPFLYFQIVSVSLSSPNFIFFKVDEIPNEDRTLCYPEWPDTDNETNQSVQEYM